MYINFGTVSFFAAANIRALKTTEARLEQSVHITFFRESTEASEAFGIIRAGCTVILPSCVIKEDAGPPTWVLFCLSVCTLYNESSSGSHHLVLAPAGCAGPAPPHNYTYNSYFSFM